MHYNESSIHGANACRKILYIDAVLSDYFQNIWPILKEVYETQGCDYFGTIRGSHGYSDFIGSFDVGCKERPAERTFRCLMMLSGCWSSLT
jgi:hypothetical protein